MLTTLHNVINMFNPSNLDTSLNKGGYTYQVDSLELHNIRVLNNRDINLR